MLRIRTAVVALTVALSLATASAACSQTPGSGSDTISKTSARKVTAQRGALLVLPQISAAGTARQSSASAKTALVATFKPAVKGRTITIQRKQGSKWVTAARAKQGSSTAVSFSVPYTVRGKAITYRAQATGKGIRPTTTKAARSDVHGKPDFVDEFSTLDSTIWNTRYQGYTKSRSCSIADDRAAKVSSGVLQLSVMKDPDKAGKKCTIKGKKYNYLLNGHVGTIKPVDRAAPTDVPSKTFKYGFFSARVKMQSARGMHSAIWLQWFSGQGVAPAKPGSEIDIIEYFGDGYPKGGLQSMIYSKGKKHGGFLPQPTSQFGKAWSKRFHVYSVQWTPSAYTFYIDGKQTMKITKGVSKVPQIFILSLLSSDWEMKPTTGNKKATMQVDWVRHWKH